MPSILRPVAVLLSAACLSSARAEDWGAYRLVPSSAQALVLEAVDAGREEGTAVSIHNPADAPGQKWLILPRDGGTVAIVPAHAPALALAAAKGGAKRGTPIVLEKDEGRPWQRWSLTKTDDGSYLIQPAHAPDLGLDHLGGKPVPGATIDLWTCRPDDGHLRWLVRPLAGTGVAPTPAPGPASGYTPPVMDPAGIPTGTVRQFSFAASKVFPGTVRDVTVFVPAQYDGSRPACVYVRTDGFNPREKPLLEAAIAAKEMPVAVGVFVRPGELPAPMKGTAVRRNRCFEYDGVNDNNVRFLTDELLPFVAKECGLRLSTDGNDRCIVGGSSGGIAAFTAAWHRPEAFSRVYAASGSWVAFRGGHEFPTMVRKFEPRPIRSFLTTATHDMENAAGDWFLLDQEMDKALTFSGYEHEFRIVEGRHVQGYAEHWREAMAYLWRGWPDRVQAGPGAPRAQDVLVPGEDWHLVAEGFKSTRGPACNATGEVYFADTSGDTIHRIGLDGRVSVFAAGTGRAHGTAVGADGAIYTVSETSGRLMRYDADGRGRVVMEGLSGHSILARPDGSLYVTSNGEKPDGPGRVWLVRDGGKTEVDTGIKFATGMACRPDRWLLSVAEGHSKWVYSYQINDDGTLANRERYFHLHVADWDDDAGAESICYSIEGRQFVATRSGIQVSADDGPTQVILPVPDRARVTGVCIGGRDLDTLFAFCGTRVWKRRIQHHASGAFTPWTKAGGTKL